MTPQHYTMPPEVLHRHAASLLQAQLQGMDYGRKGTIKTLLRVLFYAAYQLCSPATALFQVERDTDLSNKVK